MGDSSRKSLVGRVIGQFAKPRGTFGRLVGFVLANRASNIRRGRWTIALLGLSPDDRVLEIGCGPGVALVTCVALAKDGAVVGLDHSDVMIEQARRRNAKAVRRKRLKLVRGTIEDLPANEPPFDRIFAINVIQFIADKDAFIVACAARLAPRGVFAITFQPRGTRPTREAAIEMAKLVSALMAKAGLTDIRTELLEMKTVPAICVLGKR